MNNLVANQLAYNLPKVLVDTSVRPEGDDIPLFFWASRSFKEVGDLSTQLREALGVAPCSRRKFTESLDLILYNVVCSALYNKIYGLKVPIALMTSNGSPFQRLCGRDNLNLILNWLEDSGFITRTKGYRNKGHSTGVATKILATPRFINEVSRCLLKPVIFETSLVCIKNDEKAGIEGFEQEVSRTEEVLSQLNKLIEQSTLRITKGVESQCGDAIERYLSKNIQGSYMTGLQVTLPLQYNSVMYRRVYSGRIGTGGRLIGGIQSIPKSERFSLTIQDKNTCELDYSGCHVAILYAKSGQPTPNDPYCIQSAPRSAAKKLLLIALNASSKKSAIKALKKEARDAGKIIIGDIEAAFTELEAKHAPIANHFFSEAWKTLQHDESQIMLGVVEHFAKKGVICLSVHDSAIVLEEHESELAEVMASEFKKHTGADWSPITDRKDGRETVKVIESGKEWTRKSDKFIKYLGAWQVGQSVEGVLENITEEKSPFGPKTVLHINGLKYYESNQIKGQAAKIGTGKCVRLSCTSYNTLNKYNIFNISYVSNKSKGF